MSLFPALNARLLNQWMMLELSLLAHLAPNSKDARGSSGYLSPMPYPKTEKGVTGQPYNFQTYNCVCVPASYLTYPESQCSSSAIRA